MATGRGESFNISSWTRNKDYVQHFVTIIKKHGRRSVFKITYWQLNPHLLLMIFLWSAGLEELGLSAWPRAGAARLCHLAFCNMIKKWLSSNPVFVRMLALHFHSRTFAQKLRFFLFRVTEKRVLSFFLMQFDTILMEFLRNTTVSLGDVYVSKKKSNWKFWTVNWLKRRTLQTLLYCC